MNNVLLSGFMALLLMIFTACAEISEVWKAIPWAPKAPAYEPYQIKALEAEVAGDLDRALFFWKVLAKLKQNDTEIGEKILELTARIRREADQHFEKGMFFYNENATADARREFLITLRYDPDHQQALSYIKDKLGEAEFVEYVVEPGDGYERIAQKVFDDSEKAFLVSYFADLDADTPLIPGIVIRLPVLDREIEAQSLNIQQQLEKAERLLQEARYEQVIPIVEKILEYDPVNQRAHKIANEAYYQEGKRLSLQKKYLEALDAFKKVQRGYSDVETVTAALNSLIDMQAEEHYRKGVQYFVNEELAKAIAEWEQALTLNPSHEKAKEDIENARNLLKKLREVKGVE
jgi:tetratricopeptide (TPR) repeat protein